MVEACCLPAACSQSALPCIWHRGHLGKGGAHQAADREPVAFFLGLHVPFLLDLSCHSQRFHLKTWHQHPTAFPCLLGDRPCADSAGRRDGFGIVHALGDSQARRRNGANNNVNNHNNNINNNDRQLLSLFPMLESVRRFYVYYFI